MNLADDNQKGNEDSSSDEDNSVQRKNSKLSTQVITNLNQTPSSRGNSGASSQDTAHKLVNNDLEENDLPEDKEIHSDNEEEEE